MLARPWLLACLIPSCSDGGPTGELKGYSRPKHQHENASDCRAEEAEPGHARTLHLRGYVKWKTGDPRGALTDLTAAKALIPDSPEVIFVPSNPPFRSQSLFALLRNHSLQG